MRLLVTGADGFVGRHLVRAARRAGHAVVAGIGPGGAAPATWLAPDEAAGVTALPLDLSSAADVWRLAAEPAEAVVHLAAIASGADARRDPAAAMAINTDATLALFDAVTSHARAPRFLFVSTAEVYGAGHEEPITEAAPIAPVSPYAESKAAAEAALFDAAASTGATLVVARPFPHTGPGQGTRFVLPAFAARLRAARAAGDATFPVGNLDIVRDFLDVHDVVEAYLRLLAPGVPAAVYNVATGVGQHLGDCVRRLRALVGCSAEPVTDASLVRPADIPVLIGDPSRLVAATGWTPQITFDQTLKDLVDAQAD
jgi:GDP-4-dehydro-6-deoxy-D-mannose reductase